MSVVVTAVPLNVPINAGVGPPDKYKAMGCRPFVEISNIGAKFAVWMPVGYTHPEHENPAWFDTSGAVYTVGLNTYPDKSDEPTATDVV